MNRRNDEFSYVTIRVGKSGLSGSAVESFIGRFPDLDDSHHYESVDTIAVGFEQNSLKETFIQKLKKEFGPYAMNYIIVE